MSGGLLTLYITVNGKPLTAGPRAKALSTIKGYRAGLSRVFKHTIGLDLMNNTDLSALINNFSIERPRAFRTYPKWDLNIVLAYLRKAPFEPMNNSNLSQLSQKTLFLHLLAPGARRSEIHAIDVSRTVETRDKMGLVLKPL